MGKRCVRKRLVILFLFSILISINLIHADNLNLKITGSINNLTSDVYLKTQASATDFPDAYDMFADQLTLPSGSYSQFYSSVSSQKLVVDSWATNPRTIYLVYYLSDAQTGAITFSWNSLASSNYDATFTYYGTDSTYSTSVTSMSMRSVSSYSPSISGNTAVYAKILVSDYVSPTPPVIISGGGGGGGTRTISLKIETPSISSVPDSGEISIPVTFINDGQTDLESVSISGSVLKDSVLTNIKPEFDSNYFSSINSGQKQTTNLKVVFDKNDISMYDVIINASVQSPNYKTSNHFYVDFLARNASGVKKMIVFADDLVVGNPECLELKEMLDEADRLFKQGNFEKAQILTNQAIEACKKSVSGPQNLIFPLNNQGYGITFYLIVTIVAAILLGVLFYIYRIWRFRKRKEKFKKEV